MPHLGEHSILAAGGEKYFVKVYSPESLEPGLKRGRQLHLLGEKTGLFRAPRPLLRLSWAPAVVWEYLPGLANIRSFVDGIAGRGNRGMAEVLEVMSSCGRSLAAIHGEGDPRCGMDAGAELRRVAPLSPEGRKAAAALAGAPRRRLHGDFACANVFVMAAGAGHRDIVVLDACANSYLYPRPSYELSGPYYWDIAQFVSSLYSRWAFYLRHRGRLAELEKAFLDGYREVSGITPDPAAVGILTAETLLRYRDYQRRRRGRWRPADFADWLFRGRIARRLLARAGPDEGLGGEKG